MIVMAIGHEAEYFGAGLLLHFVSNFVRQPEHYFPLPLPSCETAPHAESNLLMSCKSIKRTVAPPLAPAHAQLLDGFLFQGSILPATSR